jgi:hypothetical protein
LKHLLTQSAQDFISEVGNQLYSKFAVRLSISTPHFRLEQRQDGSHLTIKLSPDGLHVFLLHGNPVLDKIRRVRFGLLLSISMFTTTPPTGMPNSLNQLMKRVITAIAALLVE